MRILILVKQIVDLSDIKLRNGEYFNPNSENFPVAINIFDKYAIEEAARIRDADSKTDVTTLTLGDSSAEQVVRESMQIVGGDGYLLYDEAFKGSDSLAVAQIIKAAILRLSHEHGPFDLILMGKQSTDIGTSQVAAMLAQLLGWDLVTSAIEIAGPVCCKTKKTLKVIKRGKNSTEEVETVTPCIVTMTKPNHDVRLPAFKRIREVAQEKINRWNCDDLEEYGLNRDIVGEKSHTRVLSVKKPGRLTQNNIIRGEDVADDVKNLLDTLSEDGIILKRSGKK